jgi:hypothetical protein
MVMVVLFFSVGAGSSVVQAIVALPNASELSDKEQIDGLTRLSSQLQVTTVTIIYLRKSYCIYVLVRIL